MNESRHQTDRVCDRRDVLKLATVGGLGIALGKSALTGFASEASVKTTFGLPQVRPIDPVRIGFVGVGGRGSGLVGELLKIEGVEIRAVCDIVEGQVAAAQNMVTQAGHRKPEGYCRGETDFRRLCERDDLDLVYTATPWRWHVPVCLAAMNAGKHAATEVPAAETVEDCWRLVETAEKTERHCVMVENCCYDRTELMILNMVRQGLFGELLHAQCGYLHDLRGSRWATPARDAGGSHLQKTQRRFLSDARTGAGGSVHERQPRQPIRPSRLDGQPVPRAELVRGQSVRARQSQSPTTLCP